MRSQALFPIFVISTGVLDVSCLLEQPHRESAGELARTLHRAIDVEEENRPFFFGVIADLMRECVVKYERMTLFPNARDVGDVHIAFLAFPGND
jgi:hypothetical protein